MSRGFDSQKVEEYINSDHLWSVGANTSASDAVRLAEILICVLDDAEGYFSAFCQEYGIAETAENLEGWKSALQSVYRRQMECLEDTIGDLRRAAKHLLD